MSEFALIYRHFQHATSRHTRTIVGIGDDCAISALPADSELVSCVDTLVAGRHFPVDTCAYAIGFKAVAVNLSDLAAMGAAPYAILLSLSLPKALACDDFLAELAAGMAAICAPFGVELIGGDTTAADTLSLSVTALGFVPTGQAILRTGAQVGDLICVSGEIGSASLALHEILAGNTSPLKSALNCPQPQLKLGQAMRQYASAMIDISDGLGQDLRHILHASGVGAHIHLDKIPCHPRLQSLPDAQKWQHILNGGDDYQLCFSIAADKFAAFGLHHPELTIYPIGQIVADPQMRFYQQNLDGEAHALDIDIKGWQHF